MVKKEDLVDKELLPFATAEDFEEYLDREHQRLPQVFVKLAKKATGIPSITVGEAVEVALCFGWIDGQGCGIDEQWWTTRFVPRRPKSMWSKKNVDTVGRLIGQGRMRPAGMAAVEAAKEDGRWDRAYAGPSTITEAEDFKAALAANALAQETYATLNKTERYSVLWKIETASPKARSNRMETLIQMLASGKKPPRPGAKAASVPESNAATKLAKVVKTTSKRTVGAGVSKKKAATKQPPGEAPRAVTRATRSSLRRV